jgi:hypothetical protein
MIKNPEELRKFEDDYIRNYNMTVEEKFKLLDSLYEFAHSTGKLTIDDSQQNLEALIKTLKVFRDANKPAFKSS